MMSLLTVLSFILGQPAYGQEPPTDDTETAESRPLRFSASTTWLSLASFGKPETNTHHYELQLGYQATPKDRLGIKLTTWKLFAPMGINLWSPALLNPDYFYPGRLREHGIGLTYQRRLWRGLYVALEVLPLITTYIDEDGDNVGRGFKLYNSYHLGYHIPFFKKGRLYIEPQLHANHWPINSGVPSAFEAEEDQWDNLFLIDPNIYMGVKF